MKPYSVKSNYRLKDIDSEKGEILAYVSIFGNVDSDNEMVMPGAFKKTISERGPEASKLRIRHLWMHSPYDIIGVPKEMKEDSEGLLVRSKFGTDAFSRDKMQQHIDGLVDEFSIGYQVIQSKDVMNNEGKREYLELQEVKLWEYSSVTWGANALTRLVEVKADTGSILDQLNDRMDRLIKALKNGKYTDESAEQFEIELKQIQTMYNELIAKQGPVSTPGKSPDGTLQEQDIMEILNILKR